MWLPILAFWGCVVELDKTCSIKDDMTNASSTYLGIAVGAAIGIAISWWIYNRLIFECLFYRVRYRSCPFFLRKNHLPL